ncbi:MAG: cytidine deaminase [Bdellovibrionaceae bacterium]|nr:cytidine deaminase [Pseudobdellovibrionaceae bacterium]
MNMHEVDKKLFETALKFLDERFPNEPWQGVAAMYVESGEILLSMALDFPNDSVSLCHETGALCEAYKLGQKITASICISGDDKGKVHVLTPCGVCQERLFTYGSDVSIAVLKEENSMKWRSIRLKKARPYYWRKPFLDSEECNGA